MTRRLPFYGDHVIEGELWRPVPGHSSYEISDHGRVRRCVTVRGRRAGSLLRPGQSYSGHLFVIITPDVGKPRKQWVHRLVAMAFIGPPPFDGAYVLHGDDVPTNNVPSNLQWGDHCQNVADAKLNRKTPGEVSQVGAQRGENNPAAVLSAADVIQIKRYLALGLCGSCIARLYGVKKETIYAIAKGRIWAHVQHVPAEPLLIDLNDVEPLINCRFNEDLIANDRHSDRELEVAHG